MVQDSGSVRESPPPSRSYSGSSKGEWVRWRRSAMFLVQNLQLKQAFVNSDGLVVNSAQPDGITLGTRF